MLETEHIQRKGRGTIQWREASSDFVPLRGLFKTKFQGSKGSRKIEPQEARALF